jgi:hypothetical protein
MSCWWWLVGLLVVPVQVPRPTSAEETARELEAARRSLLAREAAELRSLGDELAKKREMQAAQDVRRSLPRPAAPNGATTFVPLPEVVGPRPKGQNGAWRARLDEIQTRSAAELSDLAERAARSQPPRYGLAIVCLQEVLRRQSDHREARRVLGYIPHEGGWARPFAVHQFREGYVNHPVFGWVKADWVSHLGRGELPAPPARGQKATRWLSAAEADRLRARWSPPWRFATEHFDIQTNVPLAEAISFGRRLEAFYDLFVTLLADILGENLAVIRRFRDPALAGEPPYKPHLVDYFSSKDEYVEFLSQKLGGVDLSQSLGYYDPPKSGRGGRAPAYFFRDPGGQLPVTATLYHEVSHQLLFETAGPNAYTKNAGNYWVFEGLGTYFETVEPQPDGSLEVGGLVGRRIEEAIKALVDQGRGIPLARFIELDQNDFNREDEVYLHYQQAMALTTFVMQWHEGTYRNGFLDYVRDAYRGRIKRATGRSLQDRLGQPYATLDAQFLSFLKEGPVKGREREPAVQPAPGGSIRTVPSR